MSARKRQRRSFQAIIRIPTLALSLLALTPFATSAQPTNEAVFETLAVACLGDVPPEGMFLLKPPPRLPFVRPVLTRHWLAANRAVFLEDTLTAQAAPAGKVLLRYDIEEAAVIYANARRGHIAREVILAVRYTLTAPTGEVLATDRCRKTHTDTFPTSYLPLVQSTTYAEAQGTIPEAGRWRRWLEPAVLIGTLGVLTYLFFAVRGEGS